MFFHAFLAHTGNDATNFQGITDRLTALSFVDHDLHLKSGESIKDVTVKRRAQSLRQLPDHTRFAGRLVLVDHPQLQVPLTLQPHYCHQPEMCLWNQTTTNKLPERRIDLQTKWEGLGSYGNVCPLPSIMPM